MTRNGDGEFEITLRNRQLLSVFFIIVILVAVFFTMGYVLGRDSGASAAVAQAPAAAPVEQPAVKPASDFADAPAPAAAAAPVPVTAPAVEEKVAPKLTARSGPVAGEVYLQVVAAKKPDGELVSAVLKKKGFPALIAPGPTDAVVRVLVGPFKGAEEVSKARGELEKAGFKPILRKY
jgi:cell division septation protein DedD